MPKDYKTQIGFNNYEIKDDYAVIFIRRKNGDIYEAKVDIPDLERLKSYGYAWHVVWDYSNQSWYAKRSNCVMGENGKWTYKAIYMHRFLTGAIDKEHVDHINAKDTLDNRQCNLRKTTASKNLKNRRGKNSNNKSGYRNVCWIEAEQKWVVQLQLDGKNTRLGSFDNVDEAGEFAEKMRSKHYKEFKGKS